MRQGTITGRFTGVAVALAALLLLAQPIALPLTSARDVPGLAGGEPCPPAAPPRTFDVVALSVPVSYNHWGDVDLNGRIFVLRDDLGPLLLQVAQSLSDAGVASVDAIAQDPAAAFAALADGTLRPARPIDVSPLVRPLVVRAHVGECVRFNVENLLPEPVGIEVAGVDARPGMGGAFGRNAPDVVAPGASGTYVVRIPDTPAAEGAHFLRSPADARFQTKHGLFGALVAEPKGSSWLSPDGSSSASGPEAIIARPGAADFREYVVIYHDEVELVDRDLRALPVVDPYFAYGPGTKAINLRSEPFMNRFLLHDELEDEGTLDTGHDKSQAYGSYTYGDPAALVARAYVGDPTKFRILNAGPGSSHVHHLHGGGDRWRFSPLVEDTQFDDGLIKKNPVPVSQSQRVDVQLIGPGESFNAEIEGGAGGAQQSVGDFLYHCHVVEHYLAGMWSIWRVHNTLQPGLAELPDRSGRTPAAVDSAGLVGRLMRDGTRLDEDRVRAIVERQLPPRGVPGTDDASVWDWSVDETPAGPVYLGEPETTVEWPNYASPAPGERAALRFNPVDGRLSYPFLTPHFGKRPPFAPGHGPAPYLGPDVAPGRPDGLCPAGTRRDYNVVALSVPVTYNSHGDTDRHGQVFALAEDKDRILEGAKPAKNLVLRANHGDCVDVALTSRLAESPFIRSHSKVNMHIHLVQFDVQGSDGVVTGFNFEQSVRPAASTGSGLAEAALAGSSVIRLGSTDGIRPGIAIGVGLTQASLEIRNVLSVSGDAVTLDAPLAGNHSPGERVGSEFVRYRWYADAEVGTVYWHDHVDGLNSWRHGLFGALIVEPAGSRWLDPRRDGSDERREIREGTVADIVPPGSQRAFREYVVEIQDRTFCLPRPTSCLDNDDLVAPLSPERLLAGFNLRSEPMRERDVARPLLSGVGNRTAPDTPQGDPATDLWEAYAGDPVRIRLLYGGQASTRAVNTFAVSGHRFPVEPGRADSRLADAMSLGISGQFTLVPECGAGGCARLAGDYLYHMTNPDLFWRGAWGVFRVHDAPQESLWKLPGKPPDPIDAAPPGPVRRYDVVALEANVTYSERFGLARSTHLFALAEHADAIEAGTMRAEPLVLRALPGEVVEVTLRNRLAQPVSLRASVLPALSPDPVGRNPDTTVPPGESRAYRWWADRAVGVVHLSSLGHDAPNATLRGLYGALVIEPEGSSFHPATGAASDLTLADGTLVRERVLLYASEDHAFEAGVMPYTVDVKGMTSVNYRTEPLDLRAGGRITKPNGETVGGLGIHPCQFDTQSCSVAGLHPPAEVRSAAAPWVKSSLLYGDPETPIVEVERGRPVVLRVVGGAGDQLQVHAVAGHAWHADPGVAASNLLSAQTIGPGEVANAWIPRAGPGGAGDYMWGSHRDPFLEAGAWGILRVRGP